MPKKLSNVDMRRSTTRTVLGWDINTINLVITLPQVRKVEITADLESTPP